MVSKLKIIALVLVIGAFVFSGGLLATKKAIAKTKEVSATIKAETEKRIQELNADGEGEESV